MKTSHSYLLSRLLYFCPYFLKNTPIVASKLAPSVCVHVKKFMSPGQAGPVSLYPVYRSLKSEMFDEMAILFSPLKRAITLSPYQQN